MTTELVQILDEEERRWAQTLHIEEYQSHLARSVIQVRYHKVENLLEMYFFFIAAVLLLMSFTLAEGEGGLGQIYICEPVSRGKSGSL